MINRLVSLIYDMIGYINIDGAIVADHGSYLYEYLVVCTASVFTIVIALIPFALCYKMIMR